MHRSTLHIHERDTLLIALRDLEPGDEVTWSGGAQALVDAVPQKHPIATREFQPGDPVTLFGVTVGKATQPILPGGRITVDNLAHLADELTQRNPVAAWTPPDVARWAGRTFDGYVRSDGRVGTRNHWLVIPMVFCDNHKTDVLRDAFETELGYAAHNSFRGRVRDLVDRLRAGESPVDIRGSITESDPRDETSVPRLFPHVDGIKFLKHELGCGGFRLDADALCKLFATYVDHPNVAGATLLSLGCQKSQIDLFREFLLEINSGFDKPLIALNRPDFASEEQMLRKAVDETFLGMAEADQCRRSPAPLSKLVVGVECGASDGFSGVSSSATLGATSDRVVAIGGAVLLSEFPELCGVEQEMIDRCVDDATADRFTSLMHAYASRAKALGEGIEANPSDGNIRNGLLTDAIKSAGAARKGGMSPICDVQDYPGNIRKPGLSLLCTPGNDVESTTALAGAGANLILFSTGLGTPTGNPITPVIKVSSNTATAQRMPDAIDFDAGSIIRGEKTLDQTGSALLDLATDIASGAPAKAELLGQNDFIPWKRGMSL